MFINPDETDFKLFFVRDFPYDTDPSLGVTDQDIERAILESSLQINGSLFGGQQQYSLAFYYLTAHVLVENIRNSTQGLSGQYEGVLTSKSVGSVSTSVSLPESILQDPNYSWLIKTNYGQKYLSIIFPLLQGSMFISVGRTLP